MKKLFIVPAAILAVVFIISAFRLNYNKAEQKNTARSITEQTESQQPKYILKEYNGGIAVFTPNSDKPKAEYTQVMVKSLPEYDKMLLKAGIKVYSDKELQRLIEDYDSWFIAEISIVSFSGAKK